MSSFLIDRRQQLGLTQSDIARACGVSEATVSRWESGAISNMRRDKIAALAKVLRTKPSIIMDGGADENRGRVPLIGRIACGLPILAEENVDSYITPPETIRCDFALRCVGDSMTGANIFDGDIVFVRKQETVENGEIAVVRIGDEATLKKVYVDSHSVMIVPANSAYPPRTFTGEALRDIHIEGKAVGLTRLL